jgi:hypothetical protein
MFVSSSAFAEKIYLEGGKVVDGKILDKSNGQIKIDVKGTVVTYYLDEVERIEGEAIGSSPVTAPPSVLPLLDKAETKKDLTKEEDPFLKAKKDLNLAVMDKRELVLRYMEVTGVKGQMTKSFAEIVQQAPEEKKRNLKKVLRSEDVLEELVPVYAQYFTEKDLQELIKFYESDLGQKILKTAPLILKESAEKSLQYFQGKIE